MQELHTNGSVRGTTTPWWVLEAPPDELAPPLEGTVDADVVVIGGGLTGLWTARALQERGVSAVVLEAETCGAGASARNGGFLHGYWSSLGRLRDAVGTDGALETARAADGAIAAVRALGDDVWLTEGGLLLVSASPAHDEHIRSEIALAAELGVPDEAVPVEPDAHLRSPVFRTAVYFRDGATVQPARLVRALRRGVRVYERTPALELEAGRVRTPRGVVRAPEIVVATNAWAARWPAARHLAVFRSAIVLTAPVPDLAERVGWEGGEGVFDARTFLSYFRTTRDGRVLMGSAGGTIARAESALRTLLPALSDVPVEHAWEGPIDVSSDRLPFFATVPGPARSLRRRLHRQRRRPELARRPDPCLARDRCRRPLDEPAARRPFGAAAAARAAALDRAGDRQPGAPRDRRCGGRGQAAGCRPAGACCGSAAARTAHREPLRPDVGLATLSRLGGARFTRRGVRAV